MAANIQIAEAMSKRFDLFREIGTLRDVIKASARRI
jgi:hypothetical protein